MSKFKVGDTVRITSNEYPLNATPGTEFEIKRLDIFGHVVGPDLKGKEIYYTDFELELVNNKSEDINKSSKSKFKIGDKVKITATGEICEVTSIKFHDRHKSIYLVSSKEFCPEYGFYGSELEHVIENQNKPELSLVDPNFLEGLAKVLMMGADKHGRDSFKSFSKEQVRPRLDSLMRHLNEYRKGNKLDSESGYNHLLHIAANCMIMFYHEKDKKQKQRK